MKVSGASPHPLVVDSVRGIFQAGVQLAAENFLGLPRGCPAVSNNCVCPDAKVAQVNITCPVIEGQCYVVKGDFTLAIGFSGLSLVIVILLGVVLVFCLHGQRSSRPGCRRASQRLPPFGQEPGASGRPSC